MEGCRLIAQLRGQGDQRGLLILHIELIGHRATGQEGGAVASEEFVFYIGRTAAGNRGVHPALDGVFRQAVEEGQCFAIDLELIIDAHIGKALVHDTDDIGRPSLLSRTTADGGGFRVFRRLEGVRV